MDWISYAADRWDMWLVVAFLIYAAWIDGRELRVPNWLTFPMAGAGLVFHLWTGGLEGLGLSVLGLIVGLLCLLPFFSVGAMGAGDVKMMAAMGAWVGWRLTIDSFYWSVIVGAVMAVLIVLYKGTFMAHARQMVTLTREWFSVRDARKLSAIARERKPRMELLPYGIPICIGSIGYFAAVGLIV
ncbi:MAG: A24 family peptidase [Planctomycetota bacterium]